MRGVRGRTVAAVAAVLALAAGACGDSDDPKIEERSSESTTTTTTVSGKNGAPNGAPSDGAGGGSTGTTAPGATAPAAPGGGAGGSTTTTQPPPKVHMQASLKFSCVRPGTVQTLVVQTEPNTFIGYQTVYADGNNPMGPGYYGGSGSGRAGSQGGFEETWTVAANAARGEAKVDVRALGDGKSPNQAMLTFKVSDASGSCA